MVRLADSFYPNSYTCSPWANLLTDNFKVLAKQGIGLTNYNGVTHPSQPNYFASIAGDYLGIDHDKRASAPSSVATVIDLLESKGISWAHYQEDMPYTGFNGDSSESPSHASDYVRKHNPGIHFHSITQNQDRLGRIKNLSISDPESSEFHRDLNANRLPQWLFITPNMTNDGHDSDLLYSGQFARSFLDPLLRNKNFNSDKTLILVTWDESEQYPIPNQVFGILLGGAVPQNLVGTEDNNFYNHYSQISSVSANWDLPTLGRWDVGANVFQLVANKTNDKLRSWAGEQYRYNNPYAGYFSMKGNTGKIPKPNLALSPNAAGRYILQSIKDKWANIDAPTYYTDAIEVADGYNPPVGYDYGYIRW